MASLFGSFVGPWSENSGGGGNTYELGHRFYVSSAKDVLSLGWHRANVTSSRKPTAIRLWDTTTSLVVATAPAIPDNGTVGAQIIDLPTSFSLVVGREYIVSMSWPASQPYPNLASSNTVNPQSPLAWATNKRAVEINAYGYPNDAADNAEYVGVDVYVGDPDEPPPGEYLTRADLDNALARWLDEDDAPPIHPASLPVLIYSYLQTVGGIVDEVQGKVDEIEGVVEGILGPTGSLFTGLLRGYLDNMEQLIDDTLAAVEGIAPTIGTIGTNTANTRLDQLNEAARRDVAVGESGWAQVGQTVGQGSYRWVQGADAYILTVENMVESGRFAQTVGDGHIDLFRGWAKPWDEVSYYPEHVWVQGPSQVIRGGGHWPGIALWVPPDVEWTLTAYNYTGA
jgi:hypothetical protein